MEKMILVENIPGMRGRRIKWTDGGADSSMIFLIYCKNFCKCHNIPPSQQ
jgi:hypothetical protein